MGSRDPQKNNPGSKPRSEERCVYKKKNNGGEEGAKKKVLRTR